jgi:hypothetical protein
LFTIDCCNIGEVSTHSCWIINKIWRFHVEQKNIPKYSLFSFPYLFSFLQII